MKLTTIRLNRKLPHCVIVRIRMMTQCIQHLGFILRFQIYAPNIKNVALFFAEPIEFNRQLSALSPSRPLQRHCIRWFPQ